MSFFTDSAAQEGSAQFAAVHEGATFYFTSQKNLDSFKADPAHYAPAFGGFCAYSVSVGKKFDGDPRFWTVSGNKLYVKLNGEISKKFKEDVAGSIAKAETQWKTIEHKPVGSLWSLRSRRNAASDPVGAARSGGIPHASVEEIPLALAKPSKPRFVKKPAPRFRALLTEVRGCKLCKKHLPLGPRPVLQIDPRARLLIAGQAPGRRVHDSGVPFEDASGDRLRDWMGMSQEVFYDASRVAILPMGFCFPGTGRSGDLPPRPECAEAWREQLLAWLPDLELTLVIGQYAHDYHLGTARKASLTETVRAWREFWPALLLIPHPSPRNNIWLRKNPWFESDVLPRLRKLVRALELDC